MGTKTNTQTITFPRLSFIISSIRIAYQKIRNYSDKQMAKYIQAFKNAELNSVTFYAVTSKDENGQLLQEGKKRKLIELEIGIDWNKYKELVKFEPSIILKDIPEHRSGITIEINEAINAYLELFELAKQQFPECKSEDWYVRSRKVIENADMLKVAKARVNLLDNSEQLQPYNKASGESLYKSKELPEVEVKLKAYF